MVSSDFANVPHLDVQRMPHESYIRHTGENWAGITDQKERKRLQNRLNKRASRQRKNTEGIENTSIKTRVIKVYPCATTIVPTDKVIFCYCTEENIAQKRAILDHFEQQALNSYATCDPSPNHRLRLLQLNTIKGLTQNAIMIGFDFDWLICAAISPFGRDGEHSQARITLSASCPQNLAPTDLQMRRKHHPWVDLFPLPKMRDNLLVAVTEILSPEEEEQLFYDIAESCGGKEWAGFVLWGDPWECRNWEVSVPFLSRWGWLLRGCPEILEATNHWRTQRGEKPIAFSDGPAAMATSAAN